MNIIKYNFFTIIELLIVIAVIAILTSMLLPALNKAKDTAKAIACVNNLHNIGQALHMYGSDNDGYYPSSRKWSDDPTQASRPFGSTYACGSLASGIYGQYVSTPNIFYCPAATGDYSFNGSKGWASASGEALMDQASGMAMPYFYNTATKNRATHLYGEGSLRVSNSADEPLIVEPAALSGDNHGNARTNVLYGDVHVLKLWRGTANFENYPYYYDSLIPSGSR